MELKKSTFLLVGNIPESFRSAHLRTYFSHFTEKGLFHCFHYKHRPEEMRQEQSLNYLEAIAAASSTTERKTVTSKCCVVALKSEFEMEFMKMYQNANWSLSGGELIPGKVRVKRLTVERESGKDKSSFIPWEDLSNLSELNPPSVMPQGNVGTSLSTFMVLIRECKLPTRVIKKLQLEFPKTRSSRRYGAMMFDYGIDSGGSSSIETNHIGVGGDDNTSGNDEGSGIHSDHSEEEIPPDDDHDAEEWERYEAFHDDVDKQGRSKERLFEEDLEVVWEKGGSGLVFYTDASHWDQQDGDFDEKCSQEDDWDVDMSVYYDHAGGGKDARDMRDMEIEKRLRAGECIDPWKELGGFEKHTKGIGSKLLKRSGWTAGRGIGAAHQGITEPVESNGQLPYVKSGFGYRGEKINRHSASKWRRKKMKDVIISTVYDKPEEEENTVLRMAPSTVLKHRSRTIDFLEGGLLKPSTSDHATD